MKNVNGTKINVHKQYISEIYSCTETRNETRHTQVLEEKYYTLANKKIIQSEQDTFVYLFIFSVTLSTINRTM